MLIINSTDTIHRSREGSCGRFSIYRVKVYSLEFYIKKTLAGKSITNLFSIY